MFSEANISAMPTSSAAGSSGRRPNMPKCPIGVSIGRKCPFGMSAASASQSSGGKNGSGPGRTGAKRYRDGSTATGSRWASWWLTFFGVDSTAFVRSSSAASDRAPLPARTVSSASSQCS